MKKTLLCLLFFSSNLLACGDYLVSARVALLNGRHYLLINPETMSEIKLQVAFSEGAKLSPYIGRTIQTTVTMKTPMDATSGEVDALTKITENVPAPLHKSKGTFIKIIKEEKCQAR